MASLTPLYALQIVKIGNAMLQDGVPEEQVGLAVLLGMTRTNGLPLLRQWASATTQEQKQAARAELQRAALIAAAEDAEDDEVEEVEQEFTSGQAKERVSIESINRFLADIM